MEDLVALVMKTYGIVGVLIFAPIGALAVVYRDLTASRAEMAKAEREWTDRLTALNEKVVDAQRQRVADAQAISTKLVEIVSEQSGLNKETNLALERIGDMMSLLQAALGHSRK